MISLGCAKNRVDSEAILGLLREEGYQIVNTSSRADILIINTCAFIGDAVKESIETIKKEARKKSDGEFDFLIVAGCLVQRYGKALMEAIPSIDALVGTFAYDEIPEVIKDVVLRQERPCVSESKGVSERGVYPRVLSTPPWTAYLKIAEGCDNRCSYCMIPRLRGPLASRPREAIVQEAMALVRAGVKEIVLVAQDATSYGQDLYGRNENHLPRLLADLGSIDGVRWIRLLYAHPARLDDALINAIASTPKVARYLDIPVQHGSNTVLRLMRRPGKREEYLEAIHRLRKRVRDITLRSTFILGFPGEDDGAFEELMTFIAEASFDYAGFFLYSAESPTRASRLPRRVKGRVARRRLERAVTLQKHVSTYQNRKYLGRLMPVLLEGSVNGSNIGSGVGALQDGGNMKEAWSDGCDRILGRPENIWIGRHEGQAPDVDGVVLVRIPMESRVRPGDFVNVRITATGSYDLSGHLER
jgi:ribosomal protein S12 methylthiotransferase